MEKRQKRKKRWHRVWPSSSLSSVSSFPCSAMMSLSFWPLHPLVQHVVAMLHPVCFCAVEDGRYVHPDLRREGIMWYSCRYPVTVEVWTSWWWNDRGHVWIRAWFARSCSPCTVMSVLSAGMVAAVRASVAPRLARGLHTSLGQDRSMPRGRALPCLRCRGWARQKLFSTGRRGRALWWRHGGLGEAEIAARAAYLARDLSARLGQDGGWVSASSDWHAVSAFSELVLPMPLRWGFSRCARCHISPSVGYPSILIPDILHMVPCCSSENPFIC
jgi:hypothetical protein